MPYTTDNIMLYKQTKYLIDCQLIINDKQCLIFVNWYLIAILYFVLA